MKISKFYLIGGLMFFSILVISATLILTDTTIETQNLNLNGSINFDDMEIIKVIDSSIFIGQGTGNSSTYSTCLGWGSCFNATGSSIVGIGYDSLRNNIGESVIGLGPDSGMGNSGNFVVFLGSNAGQNNQGQDVNAFGYWSGKENTGDYNSFMGYNSGYQNTGSMSLGLGYQALDGNSGDYVVAIGYRAGQDNTKNNQFIVEDYSSTYDHTTPLIQGDFTSGYLGINTDSPQNELNVIGDGNFTGELIVTGNITAGGNTGITGNYTNGNCWTAYSKGIVYQTNCSAA